MPRPSVPAPDPSNLNPSSRGVVRGPRQDISGKDIPGQDIRFQTDFAELTSHFAARAGGLSPELSAELALEVVLNEIVEQVCLATGASGAAIALERDGELVCRASSGITAPELGSRLGTGQGLSGECVRTRQVQICDDAETDSRADVVASRQLGVRSVIVLPLVRGLDLVGILEAFSTRAFAFGERDRHTLEALAQRVLNNVERAANWSPVVADALPSAAFDRSAELYSDNHYSVNPATSFSVDPRLRSLAEAARSVEAEEEPSADAEDAIDLVNVVAPSRAINIITWMLGAVVLISAVGLIVLGSERVLGHKAGLRSAEPRSAGETAGAIDDRSSAAATSNSRDGASRSQVNSQAGSQSQSQATSTARGSTQGGPIPAGMTAAGKTDGANRGVPPGSLLVYENGREVFRMLPQAQTGAQSEAPASVRGDVVQQASVAPSIEQRSVGAEQVVELPPAEAEEGLVHRVEPDYPQAARQQGIQGPVVLEVRIAEDGAVENLQLISGQPLLARAAMDAVKQWRFKPRSTSGQAIERETRVTLDFRLPH
jgi:TonB family protein